MEEVALRDPGPGEVLVRMAACAICHSDLLYLSGGWGGDLPAVFGHEAAGEVAAVGAGVTAVAPGDAVIATMVRSCGACRCCGAGIPGSCESADFDLARETPLRDLQNAPIGHGLKTGAFAEMALVHQSQVARVGAALPPELGALLACGGVTGYGAVANTAGFAHRNQAGAAVAVIGAGGVGLHSVQAAALLGAEKVIAVDVSHAQLEIAEALGATHRLTVGPDLPERVRALTGGRGLDFAFVSVGAPAAIAQSLELLAPGGWSVLMGMPPVGAEIRLDPLTMAANAQRLVGSKLGQSDIRTDIPRLIELYHAGRWKLDELVGEKIPFADANAAIASAKSGGLRTVMMF